uniref:Uncharacterized protein n=1 Tax=Anopheles christyi TaxID=43041 RepID=A0A182KDP9_9DIPT
MPFVKHLLSLSGFSQETSGIGPLNVVNLVIYIAVLLVPKVCFPYPNTEAMIRGLSELIFFTNVYIGFLCFIIQHRPYRELLNTIDSFVKEESLAERILIKLNRKINMLSVIFCCCVALLNQTLKFVMTLQLALCTMTWCFTLLYILTVGLDVTAMNGLLILFNMTLEMFGYCFLCTELATTGTLVARQSYEFRWEEHSPKVQKMISTIVRASQAPLRITACGFITVNVELFAKVELSIDQSRLCSYLIIGVAENRRFRYRYIVVFLCYCFGIVIPKVCSRYPTLEASIRSYVEIIFATNLFGGMLALYLRHDYFQPLIVELRSFTATVLQDTQSTSIRTVLVQLNLRLHKYTLCYCLYMCCVCTLYCIAPLWGNITGYRAAMAGGINATTFEFNLYLEQDFYWLDNRTSLLGYCVFTVLMFPLIYLCGCTGTVKQVAVFNIIKYCQSVLRVVVLKLEHLKKLPDVREQSDGMSEVRQLHQRALCCAERLELMLQPLLLMQFVLCIMSWCTMMLYFAVSDDNVKFINMFLLFLFVSIETIGYCYLGSQLSQESVNVGQALYDSSWSDFDAPMRKNICFMIMRSQRRVELTAAKFCTVDMEQFRVMLNVMLFKALQNDRAVLPLVLYIQQQIGIWGESPRLRYPIAFAAFWLTVAIPKLTTRYATLETLICSMAELVFVGNVICGAMLLWMEHAAFQQFIEQVSHLTNHLYRDHPLRSVQDYLQQFNRLIHHYTNRYCFVMLFLIIFYLVAPVVTSFRAYYQSSTMGVSSPHPEYETNGRAWNASNEATLQQRTLQFALHMEQEFYGLQHHANILHYMLYLAVIVPMMFTTACTVHMKVLTIASSIRYTETLLYLVMLKVDNLHRMPTGQSVREELHDIIHVHQRTLDCIALLVKALRPVLLLQLVFCVFIWCLMMLFFVIADNLSIPFVNLGILFFVITIETFGPCYFGTRLSTQAVRLSQSVYACGWPTMERDIQQGLRMVLHRTQSPVGIQAGKFCFVNVEQFQKMVNTSYSFFIVLKDAF